LAEVIVDLPDNIDSEEIDEALLREALDALAKKRAATQKAKDRRVNLTPEEKLENARLARRRRAEIQLKVNFAKKNGYQPSDDEIDAFVAAQDG